MTRVPAAVIVRVRDGDLEFEFPTILEESGAPHRVYFGCEPDGNSVQGVDLVDQVTDEIGLRGRSREVGIEGVG